MRLAWTIVLFGVLTGIVGDPVGTFRDVMRARSSDDLDGTAVDDVLMQQSVSALGGMLAWARARPSSCCGLLAWAS